jgi:hypothetical protein
MTELETKQRNRRFYFYFIFTVISIGISFWSGFRLGRTVEKDEWINKASIKMQASDLNLTPD